MASTFRHWKTRGGQLLKLPLNMRRLGPPGPENHPQILLRRLQFKRAVKTLARHGEPVPKVANCLSCLKTEW